MLGAAALAFHQDVAAQARAGHAEGVADRDRAAIDVELGRVDAELVARVQALAGEGFVQLPQVDVVDLQAMARQQSGDRKHRAYAHLVGLAARHCPALESAQRLQPTALGLLGFHQHDRSAAVGELAGIAGGDEVARTADRLELGQASQRGVGAVALVTVDHHVDHRLFLRDLVDHLHPGLDRDDLVLELASSLGSGHQLLRLQRVLVLVIAAELVALGDDVGGLDHRHPECRVHRGQAIVTATAATTLVGDRIDTATHHHARTLFDDVVRGHSDRVQP